MLSKLGTACWSGLTVKLEAVQGAVCMTCYHGVAVSPGCHACDIAVVGMIIQGQGLVGLEHPTLHLQAAGVSLDMRVLHRSVQRSWHSLSGQAASFKCTGMC